MTERPAALADFLTAAEAAFTAKAADPRSRASLARVFAALATPAPPSAEPSARLPACAHLRAAADPAAQPDPALRPFLSAFAALEPYLTWRRRPADNAGASEGFAERHANAMIAGPSGLEPRQDVWLGVSLLAPHVRYPDHNHAPEETYLVIAPGQFRQGADDWFEVGPGGSLYNPPGIRHAMRSGDRPLLAFWALLPEDGAGASVRRVSGRCP